MFYVAPLAVWYSILAEHTHIGQSSATVLPYISFDTNLLGTAACGRTVSFAEEGSWLSAMTQKYLSGSCDKSSSSLNAKESSLDSSSLISLSKGNTDSSFMKP